MLSSNDSLRKGIRYKIASSHASLFAEVLGTDLGVVLKKTVEVVPIEAILGPEAPSGLA
jgi:hypothetical protein